MNATVMCFSLFFPPVFFIHIFAAVGVYRLIQTVKRVSTSIQKNSKLYEDDSIAQIPRGLRTREDYQSRQFVTRAQRKVSTKNCVTSNVNSLNFISNAIFIYEVCHFDILFGLSIDECLSYNTFRL